MVMQRTDCHCHIFNIFSVGIRAMLEQLSDAANRISREKERMALSLAASPVERVSLFEKLKKLAELAKIFTCDSESILKMLDKHYDGAYRLFPLMFDGDFLLDSVSQDELDEIKQSVRTIRQHIEEQKPKGMLSNLKTSFVSNALTGKEISRISGLLDHIDRELEPKDERGKRLMATEHKDGFSIQYQSILDIKSKPEYNNKIFPFLGVDPRRDDIPGHLKEVGQGKTFAGIKIYAPNGFSPADPVLFDGNDCVFAYCSRNGIPVIAHNSCGGFATPVKNISIKGLIYLPTAIGPVPHSGPYLFTTSLSDGYSVMVRERANLLNHPKIWRKVLEKYNNLILVLAHFGESGDPDTPDEWRNEIHTMMHDFPTLHTDISCMSDEANLNKVKTIFESDETIRDRILYGSDYFLEMFFNSSFDEYLGRIMDIFGPDAFYQISVDNPRKFISSWYNIPS